jgi:hypothetical protein
MIGDERVRHCSDCNLNVYNLSAMTEHEAAKLIAGHSGQRLCARFYRRADGTLITQDCPWSMRAMARKASRAAAAFLTAIMSVGLAFAKGKPKEKIVCECQSTPQKEKESGINLTVMDQEGAVIQKAEVTLKRQSDNYRIFVGATDASGIWSQAGLAAGKYKVVVRSPGFRTFDGIVNIRDQQSLALKLKLPVAAINVTVSVEAAPFSVQGAIVDVSAQKQPAVPFAGSGGRVSPMRQ